MSIQIEKNITTVQVEIPKTNVAIETAVTEITVQTSQPEITISTTGVSGRDGTSGTSGTFGNVLSSSLYISGSIIPNTIPGNLTSSFSLGSSTNAWKDLWISQGTIYFIGDNQQTASISINENNQFAMQDVSFDGDVTTTSLKVSAESGSNFLIINSGSLAFKDLNGSSSLSIFGPYTYVSNPSGGMGGSFSSIIAGQNKELRLYADNGYNNAGIIISPFFNDIIIENKGLNVAGPLIALMFTGSGKGLYDIPISALSTSGKILFATTGSNHFYGNQYINGTLYGTFTPNLRIGDNFEGGIIAYILQPGDPSYDSTKIKGLITTASDISTGSIWGCDGLELEGANGTAIGTGNQNTIDVMAACPTEGAARLAGELSSGGYSDWYLPSIDELNKLYLSRAVIGGFTSDIYWSSTDLGPVNLNNLVYRLDFNNGEASLGAVKSDLYSVRPIRSFIVNDASCHLGIYGDVNITGSLNVSSSFTASLSQGYMWVGGAGNVSTLIATSSLVTAGGGGSNGSSGTSGISGQPGSSGTSGVSGSSGTSGFSINSGSFATTGSNQFNGNQTITGSLNVSGSVNIDNVIKLTPVTSFPSGQAGMLVASASYGKTNLYVYDGSNWKWLVTGSIA